METAVTILDLPLKVLDKIFQHLGQDCDKWPLALAHDYLGKAFAYHIKDAYATVSLHYLSEWYLSFVLPLCGSKVLHIDLEDSFDDFLLLNQVMNDSFDNLQSINIDVDDSNIEYIKSYLMTGTKFQTLRVGIEASTFAFSKLVNSLLKLGNLRKLHIKNANGKIGELWSN